MPRCYHFLIKALIAHERITQLLGGEHALIQGTGASGATTTAGGSGQVGVENFCLAALISPGARNSILEN